MARCDHPRQTLYWDKCPAFWKLTATWPRLYLFPCKAMLACTVTLFVLHIGWDQSRAVERHGTLYEVRWHLSNHRRVSPLHVRSPTLESNRGTGSSRERENVSPGPFMQLSTLCVTHLVQD
ncbi:hypothetical protein N656DRAFT_185910 [Canariomyces notabilis]|uniref:Uncharacterized protein n=1 Tax=Canariomyces notabilis TaxID=2074819 RepID=A0AAN6QP44_9PEZI|nr:hypothetical protein N656DRAFT_185910 [Canariomyces arenarius]